MMRTLLLLLAFSSSCQLLFGQDNVADIRTTVWHFTESLTPIQKERVLLKFTDNQGRNGPAPVVYTVDAVLRT